MSGHLDIETLYNQIIEFNFDNSEDREIYFSLLTNLKEVEKRAIRDITELIVAEESDCVIKTKLFQLLHAD